MRPGWYEDLPSNQWSGYIPIANGERFIHYWFIESENDPANDPVTIWYQGGPVRSAYIYHVNASSCSSGVRMHSISSSV